MRRLLIRSILVVCVLLTAAHLIRSILRFGKESLQMDFAAFYTAGEALNNKLSPYVNHVTQNPSIWDGISVFQHSRFLYPPLTAVLFQPIAVLPYTVAKYTWMLLNLAFIGCSLLLTVNMLGLKKQLEWWLVLLIFVATFHPMLALLERGQIDGIVLFLITLAIRFTVRGNNPIADISAGFFWALATLLKLHCIYVFPFLFLRGRWKIVGGYVLGLVLILLISLVMVPQLSIEYLIKELPRIARFGESGDETMRLPNEVIQAQRASLPEGYVQKGGTIYRLEALRSIPNASLARGLNAILRRIGLDFHLSVLSVLVFFGFFLAMLIGQIYRCIPMNLETFREVAYWQGISVIVLLSAPLTWVMNTVWLLPVAITLLHLKEMLSGRGWLALILGTLGLVIAWVPDCIILPFLTITRLVNAKYLLSETLVFGSLFLIFFRSRGSDPDCPTRKLLFSVHFS